MSAIAPVRLSATSSVANTILPGLKTAQQALDYIQGGGSRRFNIADTAAHIVDNFDALAAMGKKVASLSISSGGTQINLNARQYGSGVSLLASIKGTFTMKVTGVGTDTMATTLANAKVTHVDVADTSSNISQNFSTLLQRSGKVDKITLTGASSGLTLSQIQYNGNIGASASGTTAGLLGKVYGDAAGTSTLGQYTLSISAVSAGQAMNMVSGNAKISSVAVKDTASNITANLANLASISSSKLVKITQSDPLSTITVNHADYSAKAVLLGKLDGTGTLSVTGVTAANAATVAADGKVKKLSVSDTYSNIVANSATNNGLSKIVEKNVVDTSANIATLLANSSIPNANLIAMTSIKLSDSGAISIKSSDLAGRAPVLSKIYGSNNVKGNYFLEVTQATAADARTLGANAHVQQIAVKDTITAASSQFAALTNNAKVNDITLNGVYGAISSNLDAMANLGAKLKSIVQDSANALTTTFNQYVSQAATLAKITLADSSALGLRVTGVNASMAGTMAADTTVQKMTITDTAANVSRYFNDLGSVDSSKLDSITLSDNAHLVLSDTQRTSVNGSALLSSTKLNAGNFLIDVAGVSAATASTAAGAAKVSKVSVSDSSGNIATNLSSLVGINAKLNAITQTGTAAAMSLTKTVLDASSAVLGKISNAYTLSVTAVAAGDALALVSDTHITKVSVSDSASNLTSKLADLRTLNTAGKLLAVAVTDSSEISMAYSALSTNAGVLGKVTGGSYNLNVTDVRATDAKALTLSNSHVTSLTVSDTSSAVAAKLADLSGLISATKLAASGSVTLTDTSPLAINKTQYDSQSAALGAIAGSYSLSISGVSAADAADSSNAVNTDAKVANIVVSDLGSNITTNLDALQGLGGKLLSIGWTDTSTNLAITANQYKNDIGALSKINGGTYSADVTGVAAEDVLAVAADTNAASLTVTDSSANIAAKFDDLSSLASATTPKLTDVTQSDSATIDITKTQFDAGTAALAMTGLSSASLTVSGLAASDVATFLTANSQVATVSVSSSAADIVTSLADLQSNAAKITGITVSDSGVLNLASDAAYTDNQAALAKITDGIAFAYHATITDLAAGHVGTATADLNVDSFTVSAAGADIGTNIDDLAAADTAGKLTSVTNSDAANIAVTGHSAAQLKGLVDTLMKVTGGFTLQVS